MTGRGHRPRLAEGRLERPAFREGGGVVVNRNPLQLGLRPANVTAGPGGFPQRRISDVPSVTKEQMREFERIALEDYNLEIIQIQENVGRAVATLAHAMLGRQARGQHVVVLIGNGNKGGGGLAAARHLANMGFAVEPVLGAVEEEMPLASKRQLHILRQAGIAEPKGQEASEFILHERLHRADLVIDALVGYGLVGPPSGISAACSEMCNEAHRPVLAVDVPTGVNATTGEVSDGAVRAATTLALALPKKGTIERAARDYVGELYVADIGIPRSVHAQAGIPATNTFSEGPIVRLRR